MPFDLKFERMLDLTSSASTTSGGKSAKRKLTNDMYVIQIAVGGANTNLACLDSTQTIRVYDPNELKLVTQLANGHETSGARRINEIGFFKQAPHAHMLFSCADDGALKCWDTREDADARPSLNFNLPYKRHELLCADINAEDAMIAVGTNQHADDSFIYIYDTRQTERYLHKLAESHSKDITQLKFEPRAPNKFASAGIDGLVCLYDFDQLQQQQPQDVFTNAKAIGKAAAAAADNDEDDKDDDNENGDSDEYGEDDPDLMEQCFNCEHSVDKIGYLRSDKCGDECCDQLFAITYTNELFVWNLASSDLVLRRQCESASSAKKNILENDTTNDDEFTFVDCFYRHQGSKAASNNRRLTICATDRRGNMRFTQDDDVCVYETGAAKRVQLKQSSIGNNNKQYHQDAINCVSYWHGENVLLSAGEDGLLIKWRIEDDDANEGPTLPLHDATSRNDDNDHNDEDDEHERHMKKKNAKKKRNS